VEITETALMHDPEQVAERLDRIAALGVSISIDDYGTGYSSLGYLHRLPINALKIDRLFVTNMRSGEREAIIVRSTVALAHSLGLIVVAEGVEDADTRTCCRTWAATRPRDSTCPAAAGGSVDAVHHVHRVTPRG
jgi:EAL domain-containing protein (putative c-di-GMP-specific phosphodiesterase class I)